MRARCVLVLSIVALTSCARAKSSDSSVPSPTPAASAIVLRPKTHAEVAAAPQKAIVLAPAALSLRTYTMSHGSVTIKDIDVDPGLARIHIVDMFSDSRFPKGSYRSYSLREAIDALRSTVVVSGPASAGGSIPNSLGLVIEDRKITSPVDSASGYATGIFCVDASGAASIFFVKQWPQRRCVEAFQSGPVVVDPRGNGALGASGIHQRESVDHEHLLLAIDRRGHVHVLVSSKVNLYDAANRFSQGFVSALNIGSGTTQSGVWINNGKLKFATGNLEAPIPSVLVLTSRG